MPGEFPVTKPVLVTVAIPIFDDCQAFKAGVPDPTNVEEPPLQTDKFPVIVGNVFTFIANVFE